MKEDGRVRKREDTEEGGKPLLHTTAASYVELLIFRFQACSDWKEAVMNCVGNHSTTPLLPVASFPPALPSLYHFNHIIILCLYLTIFAATLHARSLKIKQTGSLKIIP